jgi:hypothetical protein
VARTKLGLSPKQFWNLTWYEWGLEILRLYEQQKKVEEEREFYLSVKRIEIANFINAHRGQNSKTIKPEDVFKLSFDKDIVYERPLTYKEKKALFGSRIRKDGKQ